MITTCPTKLCATPGSPPGSAYRDDTAVSVLATTGDRPEDIAKLSCGCQVTREAWLKATEPAREVQRQHDEERAEAVRQANVSEAFAALAALASRDEIMELAEAMPDSDD